MKIKYLVLLLAIIGCSSSNGTTNSSTTNNGIEVGNPNITGKSVRAYNTTDSEVYLTTFADEQLATMEKISVGESASTVVETVSTTYELDGLNVTVNVNLSSTQNVVLTFTSDENGENISNVSLTVDDTSKTVVADIETPFDLFEPDQTDAAHELTLAVCDSVSDCFAQVFVDSCYAALLTTSGLPEQFGSTSSTMSDLANLIVEGTVTANDIKRDNCVQNLHNVQCTNILNYFNPSADPADYSGLVSIVPFSFNGCTDVF